MLNASTKSIDRGEYARTFWPGRFGQIQVQSRMFWPNTISTRTEASYEFFTLLYIHFM